MFNLQAIKIIVTDLDIEHETHCTFDVLEIHDGSSVQDPVIETFCGTTVAPGQEILSTGNSVLLRLRSDSSVTGRGFSLTFTEAEPGLPACVRKEPVRLTTPSTLSVDLDLGSNEPGRACMWQIIADDGKVIHLSS